MFGLACSKFGLKISGTCSRRSKFDPPKFEEFEVRLFDVRSKTSIFAFTKIDLSKDIREMIVNCSFFTFCSAL